MRVNSTGQCLLRLYSLRFQWLVLAFLIAGVFAVAAQAATVSWSPVPITVKVKDAPLSSVIEIIMTHNGLPVVVSDGVKGTVSLSVTRPSKLMFEELVNMYNLDWSYDGGMVSVIPARERITKMFETGGMSVSELNKALGELQISDPRVQLRSANNGSVVSVSSTPKYVNTVEEAIKLITSNAKREAKSPAVIAPAALAEDRRVLNVFKLQYATAADVSMDSGPTGGTSNRVQGVASMLRETMELFAPSASDAPPMANGPTQRLDASFVETIKPLFTTGGDSSAQLRAIGQANSYWNSRSEREPRRDSSGATIIADARTNSVFVYDLPSRVSTYQKLIQTLDVPARQVEVEVMVVDISDGISEEFSVKWRALRDEAGRPNATTGSTLVSNIAAGNAALALSKGAFDRFMMDIRLQEASGYAQVVTRPRVVTRDGVEALFSATDSFQLRLAGRDTVDTREISTGMVLKVRPRVIATEPTESVELSLYFQDGEFGSAAVEGVPVQRRTQLTTLANVQDQNTLVVGGHLFERTDRGVDRTPYFADIPVLGALFRSKSSSSLRRERLIFITPRIMRITPSAASARAVEILEGLK
jgi:type III secretion protein C